MSLHLFGWLTYTEKSFVNLCSDWNYNFPISEIGFPFDSINQSGNSEYNQIWVDLTRIKSRFTCVKCDKSYSSAEQEIGGTFDGPPQQTSLITSERVWVKAFYGWVKGFGFLVIYLVYLVISFLFCSTSLVSWVREGAHGYLLFVGEWRARWLFDFCSTPIKTLNGYMQN